MPDQTKKPTFTSADLIKKLGPKIREAHEQVKSDNTNFSQFGDLPPGIKVGVAQLVDIKIDKKKEGDANEGEFYFYAAGIVKEPKTAPFKGVQARCAGLRTSITEPLYDTPDAGQRKTVKEHLAYIYNELRKLGVTTKTMKIEDLTATFAALMKNKPFFKFSTSAGKESKEYPDPRTFHNWDGKCEYTPDPNAISTGMQMDAPANGVNTDIPPDDTPAQAPDEQQETGMVEAMNQSASGSLDVDQQDVDSLVALAEGDSEQSTEAQQRLIALAVEAGIDEETAKAADTWTILGDMIKHPPQDVPETEAQAPKVPKKGGTCHYQQKDAKGQPVKDPNTKKAKKPVECVIETVDEKNKVVTLKSLDDGKVIMNTLTKKALAVKWDDIVL
jgi:hypothetical protein